MAYLGNGRWGLKHLPVTSPKGTPRLKKITYKPEYDEPPKKKPATRKKKATTRRATTTTANTKTVAQPKKKLPPMPKRGWLW